MISIVGFGRPKFGGVTKSEAKPASKEKSVSKEIQEAINLLKKSGYTVSK